MGFIPRTLGVDIYIMLDYFCAIMYEIQDKR